MPRGKVVSKPTTAGDNLIPGYIVTISIGLSFGVDHGEIFQFSDDSGMKPYTSLCENAMKADEFDFEPGPKTISPDIPREATDIKKV